MNPHDTKPGDLVRICRDARAGKPAVVSAEIWRVNHVYHDGAIEVSRSTGFRVAFSWVRVAKA